MRLQSQILQTLRAPGPQARLEHIVARGAFDSRAALGREVCAQFGFVDARGAAQLAGCLKALAVLETAGQIALPQPRPYGHRPSPRCLDAPVPAPVEVPAQMRDVEGLRLVVVEDEEQRRVWNTLLATEHPHGTTTFVGCRAPAEVVATLLDEGQYLCSQRTMYRILAANQPVRERRNQLEHPRYTKPERVATGPNETWSWDITRLLGPTRWSYFYLYVLLDIFSRYVIGWMVAERENSVLAATLIEQTCLKLGGPDSA